MAWRSAYQRSRSEEGLSLIEMLVAVMILGIVLSGLAASMIASLKNAARNERVAIASAAQTQLLETLQATEWSEAAVYRNELADLPAELQASLDLTVSPPRFEGEEVVVLEPYTIGARDAHVPHVKVPSSTLCAKVRLNCTAYQLVLYVDRDGDLTPETKRFVTFITYQDINGAFKTIRSEAERTPATDEVVIVSEARLLTYSFGPSPADLFDAIAAGGPDKQGDLKDRLAAFTRFNQGVRAVTVTFQSLEKNKPNPGYLTFPAGNTAGMTTLALSPLGPLEKVGTVDYYSTWTLELAPSSYRFLDGFQKFTLQAITQEGKTLIHENTIEFRNGGLTTPGVPATPSPSASASASPSPSASASASASPSPTTGPSVVIVGGNVTIQQDGTTTPICTTASTWLNIGAITVQVSVTGLTTLDQDVTVTYDKWSKKNGVVAPVTRTMTPLGGTVNATGATTFTYVIPAKAEFFKKGEVIPFVVKARRPSDPSTADQVLKTRTVSTC